MLGRMAAGGGAIENGDAILVQLRESFGLDQPLIVQYLLYIKNTLTLDFGLSTATSRRPWRQLIGQAHALDHRADADLARHHLHHRQPSGRADGVGEHAEALEGRDPAAMVFTAIPPLLSGLLLMYFFSSQLGWFPLTGAYSG
jgi:peptide/nickel transport system permease protein